jgi:hypothetical protein
VIERWLAAIRDDPNRPPPHQVNVLAMLALRLDWKTGTGHVSVQHLALDAGARKRTVLRATRWAREAGYLMQTRRGHRIREGAAAESEWKLTQPATSGTLAAAQHATSGTLAAPQGANNRDPTCLQGTANQESSTSRTTTRRTTRTGSRGRATATDDDDDDSSAHPLTRAARDPRTLLGGLGIEDQLTEHILGWLADQGIRDPFGYLFGIIGKHPDAEDGIRRFLDRRRRELADADDDQPPGPPKPPWCGECDEDTRLAETGDGRMARCIRCHPLSVHPPEDSGSSWPPWCGDPDCNPATRWRDSADGLHADKCPKCHPDLAGSQP